MTAAVRRLLFEAYRRKAMRDLHEQSKPLTQRWLGLGTAAAYRPVLKSGLMQFFDGREPPPRCMGWLVLTDRGVQALQDMEAEFSRELKDLKNSSYRDGLRSQYMLAGGLTA